jgi:protease I
MTFDQAKPDDFDGILLPGGAINADTIRMIPQAREFVKFMDKNKRPMAVICHAPWLLVSSGCAKGRTLTSYYTIQDDIRNAGANWVDKEMVRDSNLVTSRSPQDLSAFNPAIVSLFAEYKNQKPHDVLSA